jgi:zinc-binding alcohol dehydrogenase/oxidoreductase
MPAGEYSMKALVLEALDGPQCAAVRDIETPRPKAGEVLVALKGAALNHRELWLARGQYPGMIPTPFGLGCDGAGIIEAAGEGVADGRVGEAVVLYPGMNWGPDPRFPAPTFGLLGMPGPGTIAEKICVPATHALAKPAHLGFEQAAAVALAGLTAWRGLFTKGGLKAGEKLLLTGIGGGVATLALQFATGLGASVYVTSSSDETLERAVALGAKAGFNYKDDGWRKVLPKASGGIDVVLDGAPAMSYPNYGRALSTGARVVIYGSTGGLQVPVNAPELFLRNISVIGTNVGNLDEFATMLAFVSKHRLVPVIDSSFSLDTAAEALCHLPDHKFGKVVIAI